MALTLHIFLGSAGYQDEDYQLSLALLLFDTSLAADAPSQLNNVRFTELFPRKISDLYRQFPAAIPKTIGVIETFSDKHILIASGKGGGTGVGGGGDMQSILIKIRMIRYAFALAQVPNLPATCKMRWADPTTYISDVLQLELESDPRLRELQVQQTSGVNARLILPPVPLLNEGFMDLFTNLSIQKACELLDGRNEKAK
jgi:hypothetical protein